MQSCAKHGQTFGAYYEQYAACCESTDQQFIVPGLKAHLLLFLCFCLLFFLSSGVVVVDTVVVVLID